MRDGRVELSVEKLQTPDGVRALNEMLRFLFDKVTEGGENIDISFGYGTPEGALTKGVGSVYLRLDGGSATTLYVKESGAAATGWAAK